MYRAKAEKSSCRSAGRAALGLTLIACLCGGCAKDHNTQVWTTKDDPSLLIPKSDIPAPNMGEAIPVTDAASLQESAKALLLHAADSTNPLLRANAIEALHPVPQDIEPVVRKGLGDENRGVRFVAAMSVGKLKIDSLAPLLEPLLHDESKSVQAAAIYGLRSCGRTADLNPLSEMLLGDDAEVKGNAALVLGELGDPSAIPMLRNSIGRGLKKASPSKRKIVELQLAEAMVKLGATNQVDVIRAALFSPIEEGELAILACVICGELKDAGALPDLHNIVRRTGKFERPPEIRMAAAYAIAKIESTSTLLEVPVRYASHPRFELRAQAAQTLGQFGAVCGPTGKPAEQVLGQLAKLLNDPNPLVQVSAAGGVLRVPSGSMAAMSRF